MSFFNKIQYDNLQLENITFSRQKKTILKNISLSLSSHHTILMTGQNGSGKSTLLKIISGLLKPDNSSLSIQKHHQYHKIKYWFFQKKILRQYFCYLHQVPYLFNGSVFDNVAYGLKDKKLSTEEIQYKVNEALKIVNLVKLVQRKSHALSGGEKQRIAIARSWVIQPSFMLLDEPFANMDKHSRHRTYDCINQLKEKNIGIILTSHAPQHGALKFNRHLHLYQGKMSEQPIK